MADTNMHLADALAEKKARLAKMYGARDAATVAHEAITKLFGGVTPVRGEDKPLRLEQIKALKRTLAPHQFKPLPATERALQASLGTLGFAPEPITVEFVGDGQHRHEHLVLEMGGRKFSLKGNTYLEYAKREVLAWTMARHLSLPGAYGAVLYKGPLRFKGPGLDAFLSGPPYLKANWLTQKHPVLIPWVPNAVKVDQMFKNYLHNDQKIANLARWWFFGVLVGQGDSHMGNWVYSEDLRSAVVIDYESAFPRCIGDAFFPAEDIIRQVSRYTDGVDIMEREVHHMADLVRANWGTFAAMYAETGLDEPDGYGNIKRWFMVGNPRQGDKIAKKIMSYLWRNGS